MSSSKFVLNVEWEQVDAIVVQCLKNILEDMNRTLDAIDNDERTLVVFDQDVLKERSLVKEHIAACNLILAYYGERL